MKKDDKKGAVKKIIREKTIITSALPYVNNVPHLGNLVCVISADVYSRYLKLVGKKTIYVLGTDEHGTTAEIKALEEGITPKQLVDKYFKIHDKIYKWFECEPDCLGRTSSNENKKITEEIFKSLDKNGFIKEDEIEQLYCPKCRIFLSDRYTEGTCPKCKYEKARGDQCDNCGTLLDPKELINPKCKICGATPLVKKTKHLFLDLPKLQPQIEEWVDSEKGNWTENAVTMTNAWLKDGLKIRDISRDLKWGIKIPKKGYEEKVFYSWFDAPIGYIGITAENKKDWESWWKNPESTNLVQFMGKDNIPFHTILFPSYLIGTGEKWTLPTKISVNEYLNYETGKFSKSRGEGVFGDDAISTGINPDIWRYYLMKQRPEKSDIIFTWGDFQEKINKELVGNLGNLIHRTLFFINKYFESKIPEIKNKFEYSESINAIKECFKKIEIRKAVKQILDLSQKGNQYFQSEEPWSHIVKNRKKTENAIANLAAIIKDISILINPLMPETSKKIQETMNLKKLAWKDLGGKIKKGHEIKKSEPLFEKLEDDKLKELKEKFKGKTEKEEKDEFGKVDLKTALIEDVKDHPDAENLYIIDINLGEENRQLVAGLKKHFHKSELIGKKIVVVANLKPAKLRDVESRGMLLAADDGKKVVMLEPGNANPGTDIYKKGCPKKPAKEITIDEFAKMPVIIGENFIAEQKNQPLMNNLGEFVIAKEMKKGTKVR